MFLDDQIVEMVLEAKPQDYDSEIQLLTEILKLCLDRVRECLRKDMTDFYLLSTIKQVCNSWNSASRQLEKNGYPFLKIDGFKNYLLSKPDFAKMLIPMGF